MQAEKRNRIRLSLAAYAYEILNHPILSDNKYDQLAKIINPMVLTNNIVLDVFFMGVFTPDSGIWIHQHPEPSKLANLFDRLKFDGICESMWI